MSMRIIAIDPGTKNIGIALSDATGTIASPFTIIKHQSRNADADVIIKLAEEKNADRIIVGQNLDDHGEPTLQGRSAARLAGAIKNRTEIMVIMWDESGSTKTAREEQILLEANRKKRRGHLDDIAAAVILQTYLDSLSG